jgi:UDP-2-acetamido-3-amino-2,3-dideoxy-glucuronate N-acetyltransferase
MSGATNGYFVHPTAVVDAPPSIGRGTKIWHFCHVMSDVTIGQDCNFGQNVFIASGCRVGNNVKIQNNVSLYTGVNLEDDVFCGPSAVFTNVGTPRSHFPRRNEYQQTLVKRGASIGANATIVCGHSIGRYAFIGAGAVVTRDVPDYAMVYGNPARLRGWVCYCGIKLPLGTAAEAQEAGACTNCSRRYERRGLHVTEVDGGATPAATPRG